MKIRASGIAMLEEATGLLRVLPARSWTVWLAGTLPFTWLLIDYLLVAGRSEVSDEQLAGNSILLGLLYVWKQVAQSWFSRDCLQILRGDALATPSATALLRTTLVQAAWQPFRFLGLFVAGLAVAPFPWAVAFFRNIGLAALDRERGFVREAWQVSRSDTRAHVLALLLLFLCGLLLFLNLVVLWFLAPMLLKAFFGMQTEAGRLALRLLNVTTVLSTAIVTTAILEPAANAIAAIRVFWVRSHQGGDDLRGALRRLAAGVALGTLLLSGVAAPLAAQERPLDGQRLQREIQDVLRDPEFAWKSPGAHSRSAVDTSWLRDFFAAVERWVRWIFDWYRKLFPDQEGGNGAGEGRWGINPEALQNAMLAVAAITVVVCLILLFRYRRRKKSEVAPAASLATPITVNLADESISAAQLAEAEWLQMAEDLAATGDYRRAVRALHLAGLRYLGESGWVTLQPAKTGREYGRELARRVRDVPVVIEGFGRGLRQYEGIWYGFDAPEAESYRALRETWQEMRRHA